MKPSWTQLLSRMLPDWARNVLSRRAVFYLRLLDISNECRCASFPGGFADVQTQGVCNRHATEKNCGGVLNTARDDRHAWPSDVESAQPLYGQTEEYTLFADFVAQLIRQVFRDLATKKSTCTIPGVQESVIFRCSITHAPALIMSVLRI